MVMGVCFLGGWIKANWIRNVDRLGMTKQGGLVHHSRTLECDELIDLNRFDHE